ncbi:MAG TPA: 4-hydroxy-tetrahydrodipicolinate synthase [Anaerolineae bacterium]|nr:4-hydroxy-tetrahydrodipicolinate synthase [Anaerolineae bacterium]
MIRPTGSWVALITPFTQDQAVDIAGFCQLVDFHMAHGTNGLLLCGSTGEPSLLTTDEKRAIYDGVLPYARGKIPIFVGTTCGSTAETVELSRYAQQAGADGLLLVVPPYSRPPQEAIYQHFRTVAEAVDLPIAIYNNPSRVGVNIDAETIIRLAEIPNIVADKEAIPNVAQLAAIMGEVGDRLHLLCCDYPGYSLILPTLALGGHGTANVTGNIIPEEMAAMSRPWHSIEDVQRSRELYFRYLPLLSMMYSLTSPVPVKTAVGLLGLPAGSVRRPLPDMAPAKVHQLQALLDELGVTEKYRVERSHVSGS